LLLLLFDHGTNVYVCVVSLTASLLSKLENFTEISVIARLSCTDYETSVLAGFVDVLHEEFLGFWVSLKQLSQLESEDSHIWENFKFDDFGRKETHELFGLS